VGAANGAGAPAVAIVDVGATGLTSASSESTLSLNAYNSAESLPPEQADATRTSTMAAASVLIS
ncbi:MAG TPA: hypothetical protein QGG16_10135, partial [Acidimicrobiales bacterium]|nr:hypothetical protein [Acidimicrobiales bacterium]